MAERTPLRVGVLGAGTVGREVVRAFVEHPERLAPADGQRLELAGVAVRDVQRHAGSGIPEHLLTDAPAHLVAAPDIDVIVELIGGDEPAHTLIAAALGVGKPVVTANKHVLAHHGPELETIARRTGAALRFEAAVGGGIPVLGPLASELAGNRVTRIRGIVNGTTNYILSAMGREGCAYSEVLAAAQAAGFAEADPRGDVEGDDAVNKLVLLARLGFGVWVAPGSVSRRPPSTTGHGLPGITGVTTEEIRAAAVLGLTIRLLAVAERPDTPGADPPARVLPAAVPLDSPFGFTTGVLNRVEVEAEPLGRVAADGAGAGGGATASAVLGDLIAVARGLGSTWAGLPAAPARREPRPGEPPGPFRDASGWFAFLPRVAARRVRSGSAGLYAVEAQGGIAVRSSEPDVEAVCASIRALLDDPVDVPIYPIED